MKKTVIVIVSVVILILVAIGTIVWVSFGFSNRGHNKFVDGVYSIDKALLGEDENTEFIDGFDFEQFDLYLNKISLSSYKNANQRNVLKNNRNKKTYSAQIYIKFSGEACGRYYDFNFLKCERDFYTVDLCLKNDELGLNCNLRICIEAISDLNKDGARLNICSYGDKNNADKYFAIYKK